MLCFVRLRQCSNMTEGVSEIDASFCLLVQAGLMSYLCIQGHVCDESDTRAIPTEPAR